MDKDLKTIVFDTKPLNSNLRGFACIFKYQNLCYNQRIIKIKVYEFIDLNKSSHLSREAYYIDKVS